MLGDEEGLGGGRGGILSGVLAERCGAIGGSTAEQNLLGGCDVLVLASPGLEHGLLEGATIGEGQLPWLEQGRLVDGVEISGGVQLALSSREEGDAWNGGGHSSSEGLHGRQTDILVRGLLGRALTGRDHVRLEEGALQVDVVIGKRLVDEGQHLLGDLLCSGQVVISVAQHLRLDDGHEAGLLTDRGVSGKNVGVLEHAQMRGRVRGDGEDAAPLGEAATALLESCGLCGESIQSLGGSLSDGAMERHDSEVELDAWNDALLVEQIDELLAGVGGLVEGLLVEDHSGDVLVEVGRGEEQLTVLLSVLLIVLEADGGQALTDSSSGLVSCKDSLAVGDDLGGDLAKLLLLGASECVSVRASDLSHICSV
ncbi:hypothetical protein PENTCL1PPCAC_13201, partial [Pristionchus entomophagus]